MPRRHVLEIGPSDAGTRLDVFLARGLAEYSREFLKGMIARGLVTLDGRAVRPAVRLKGAGTVVVEVPDPTPASLAAETVALEVCFEDEHLLVVSKPRGMLTHPAGLRHVTGTLVNALLGHCADLAGIGGELRPGIVHRLDRETSGLLVVAKSDRVHRELSAQFKARTVRKEYFAIASGVVRPSRGVLCGPIGRHPVVRNRMRVDENRGRAARTEYRVLAVWGDATLLLIRLHTGRTHQIRVHFAALGHPLIGDALYGAPAPPVPFAGVALHSARLAFTHPVTGQRIACSRPVPDDIRAVVRSLAGRAADRQRTGSPKR